MNPFSFNEQPVLQNILATLNVIECYPVNYFYVGLLPFNTSEIHTNNLATLLFIHVSSQIHNNEGANRGLNFMNVGGTSRWLGFTYVTGLSGSYTPILSFTRLGVGTGVGNIANAATTVSFSGYRVTII